MLPGICRSPPTTRPRCSVSSRLVTLGTGNDIISEGRQEGHRLQQHVHLLVLESPSLYPVSLKITEIIIVKEEKEIRQLLAPYGWD